MMPVAEQPAPSDEALLAGVARYRRKAEGGDVGAAWKAFRGSPHGVAWFEALTAAYGERCLYCDHAPGRTIDHATAKTASAAGTFAWKNHRPSCGDCNRLKGTRAIVDPVQEDPRGFVCFDTTTGKPELAPGARRKRKAEETRRLLDHQTLNDARRAKQRQVLVVMGRFLAGEEGYDERRVLDEVTFGPHRAIVRDLVFDAELDPDLFEGAHLVRAVLRRLPGLRDWAKAPVRRGH